MQRLFKKKEAVVLVVNEMDRAIKTGAQSRIQIEDTPVWLKMFAGLVKKTNGLHKQIMEGYLEIIRPIFDSNEMRLHVSPFLSNVNDLASVRMYITKLGQLIERAFLRKKEDITGLPYYRDYFRIYAKLSCEDFFLPVLNALETRKNDAYAHLAEVCAFLAKSTSELQSAISFHIEGQRARKQCNEKITEPTEFMSTWRPTPECMSESLRAAFDQAVKNNKLKRIN